MPNTATQKSRRSLYFKENKPKKKNNLWNKYTEKINDNNAGPWGRLHSAAKVAAVYVYSKDNKFFFEQTQPEDNNPRFPRVLITKRETAVAAPTTTVAPSTPIKIKPTASAASKELKAAADTNKVNDAPRIILNTPKRSRKATDQPLILASPMSAASETCKTLFFGTPRSGTAMPPVEFHTPHGSELSFARHHKVTVDGLEGELLLLSEKRKPNAGKALHSLKRKGIAAPILTAFKNAVAPPAEKSHPETVIIPHKRHRRDAAPARKVMGRSAREELHMLLERNKITEEFSEEQVRILKLLAYNFKTEWLHCLAHSLCPEELDPQDSDNFGLSSMWTNSGMMPLERVALAFAKLYPGAVSVKPLFKMLLDTNVIDKITYKVIIEAKGHKIILERELDALKELGPDNWPSSTDPKLIDHFVKAKLDDKAPTYTTSFDLVPTTSIAASAVPATTAAASSSSSSKGIASTVIASTASSSSSSSAAVIKRLRA